MSEDKGIDAVFGVGEKLEEDALFSAFACRADLAAFDYGVIYAYSQTAALPLAQRARQAAHFLDKIRDKKLDNDTIKTILDTLEADLPGENLVLIRPSAIADRAHAEAHYRELIYLPEQFVRTLYAVMPGGGGLYYVCACNEGALERQKLLTLDNKQKLEILGELAGSVQTLHEKGLVHGMLRPAEFAVVPAADGFSVRLNCLGLRADLDRALEAGGNAAAKDIFVFSPPEVLSGEQAGCAGDIYSLGALTYYLLCGSAPWPQAGNLFDLLESLKRGEPAVPEQELQLLPENLRAVIRLSMSADPAARYASAAELADDLRACLEGRQTFAERNAPVAAQATDLPPIQAAEPSPEEVKPASSPAVPVTAPAVATEPTVHAATINTPATHQPLFMQEPRIPDITQMDANMGKAQNSALLKVGIVAAVLAVCAAGGYFLSGGGRSPSDSGTPSEGEQAGIVGNEEELIAEMDPPETVVTPRPKPEPAQLATLLQAGNRYMAEKDYEKAAEAYAQAAKIDGSSETEGLLKAAELRIEQKQKFEAALALAERMLAVKDLEQAESSIIQALAIAGYQDDTQAKELQNKIYAEKFAGALGEGQRYLEAEKWKEAAASFAWALSIRGYENDARAIEGRTKAENALAQAEKKRIEEENRLAGLLSRFNAALAEATRLESMGRWDEAVAAYDLALGVEGYADNDKALAGKKSAQESARQQREAQSAQQKQQRTQEFDMLMARGNALLGAGLWAKAEESFSKAAAVEGYVGNQKAEEGRNRAINGSARETNRNRHDNLLLEGYKAVRQQEYESAEKNFQEALTVRDFESSSLARQGAMFAQVMGRGGNKERQYREHIERGNQLLRENQPAEAALEFGRAIVIDKDKVEAYLLRGQAHLAAGNDDKAIASFAEARELAPGTFAVLAAEAMALIKQQKFAESLGSIQAIEALELDEAQRRWLAGIKGWLVYAPGGWNSGKRGVRADNARAVEFFTQAAELGDAGSLNNLAVCHLEGRGVKRDQEQGIKLLREAAEKNIPEALFNLGLALHNGTGTERDYTAAAEYFQKAADAGINRAWGRLADMYERGRGVERDREKAKELAERNEGRTDRDNEFMISEAVLATVPAAPATSPKPAAGVELTEQYEALMAEARSLLEQKDYKAAGNVFVMASLLEGRENDSAAREGQERARKLREDLERAALALPEKPAATTPVAQQPTPKPISPDGPASPDLLSGLPEAPGQTPAATPGQPQPNTPAPAVDTVRPAQPPVAGLAPDEFRESYTQLVGEAKRQMGLRNWGFAEQSFRLALALPGNLDDGGAMAGLTATLEEKRKAIAEGSAKFTDYEAVMSNAVSLLRDRQWPQAIHMFKYAQSLDGFASDKAAAVGLAAAEKAFNAETAARNAATLPPEARGDVRDMASYQLAMGQAQEFLANKNYNAAIQMAQIVLGMSGFEGDEAAAQLLQNANRMKAESENSPEAVQLRRERNRQLYQELLITVKMHIRNLDWEKAQKAVEVVLRLPGYENDGEALSLKRAVENQSSPEATANVTPEAREQFLALMQQANSALTAQDWLRAEESFRLALQIQGFEQDPAALSGLDTALRAQGKPTTAAPGATIPSPGDLTQGFITAEDNIELIRKQAAFDALMREGKRQFDLMQYQVAAAVFDEALAIKGFENHPEALALRQRALELRPKPAEVRLPETQTAAEDTPDPRADIQRQAALLLNEGNRLREQRDFNAAVQAYSNGLDLEPDNLKLRINRADTRAAIGQFDQALADYDRALGNSEIDPQMRAYVWNNIANVHYYGLKDYEKAVTFYTKSAEAGNAAAMNSLGVSYGAGRGVAKDPAKSLEWYTAAAEKGYGNAMLNLGLIYQNGWSTEVNNKEAYKWYEKAAENKIGRAYARLAIMYTEGLGVEADAEKAEQMRQKARELGYTQER